MRFPWIFKALAGFVGGVVMILIGPTEGAAQCGDCVGVPGIAHVFTSEGEDGTHVCIIEGVPEPAGCHTDWYLPGCGVHDDCMEGEEQDLLAEAIESGAVERVRSLLGAMSQTFSYDPQQRVIAAECEGFLVARFFLSDAVDAEQFVANLGLLE